MEFGQFVAKLGRREREEGSTCAVCLRRIEEEDEIQAVARPRDEWRAQVRRRPVAAERMFYLFGEDCVFGDSMFSSPEVLNSLVLGFLLEMVELLDIDCNVVFLYRSCIPMT
ncbi:unnamed protein product [Thlaspi arvense]|uniref:Uncharacterized protein n=1 Tax=Thlaspi arvense TaxID=13288 RepID=A0AAU9RT33_THLAR|nr:unnamed protein product [Thlaspi arvense]